ncbi:NAD(P)-dependent oxidoreductase [Trujillonella endophytica]|uniref:3-hydroxyisobutyrate dehydrogenase n=1 Tax=Trujillonella endophytica TaxID=673521 RepID=A0A1H8QTY1_9ACTN|nr:NAD(P)-dependent oxidoreductase [Trujillella endophytica]SEO57720.1 3-hydroxyisobutyrate dehydrogenase [Trujillella endophytica]
MATLFVGLGRMGAPMVRRYAGTTATVLFDVDTAIARALADDIAARPLDSLAELPDDVDTVILMLPNSRIVESVLEADGLLDRLPGGALVIDMGSSEPTSTRRLAEAARERGIGYVDAPVSGGVAKAVTGQLSIMVGGEVADASRARPHLAPMGATILDVGPSGAGHAAKALNNLLSATNIAAAAEVLAVASSFGIDPGVMVAVLNASTGRSQATEVKYPKYVVTGCYDSGFAMDLMLKDVAIAQSLARGEGLQTPVTDAAAEAAGNARATLARDDLDHTELARYYEYINQVSFRATGA